MIEKITKIDVSLSPSFVEISKQPTIQVGLKGKLNIHLNDETCIEDVTLGWDDCPFITDKRIAVKEGVEIIKKIQDRLFGLAEEITSQISSLLACETFEIK